MSNICELWTQKQIDAHFDHESVRWVDFTEVAPRKYLVRRSDGTIIPPPYVPPWWHVPLAILAGVPFLLCLLLVSPIWLLYLLFRWTVWPWLTEDDTHTHWWKGRK